MIISALAKRYEEIATPAGWQNRDISYALDIDERGQLLDILPLETEELVGKKKVTKKRRLLLPLAFVRSSNADVVVNFLWDGGEYMLGLKPIKFETATKFHTALLANVDSPQARAICAYFNAGIPQLSDAMQAKMKKPESANFIFYFNGRAVDYEVEPIRQAWDAYNAENDKAAAEGGMVRCLVTGRHDIPQYSHNKIQIRGQGNAGPLIGANAESFTSYGKTAKDRAADIGKTAAFAYFSALEGLIKDKKHSKPLGGDTLLFWAEEGGDKCVEIMGDMLDPQIQSQETVLVDGDWEVEDDDEGELEETVNRIIKAESLSDVDLFRNFHMLCLSPNAARVSVRFFLTDSFGNLIRNIQAHYNRLNIVSDGRTKFPRLPVWLLLSETTIKGSASDAHPLLAGQLMHNILQGQPYPMTLYNAILGRIRAGADISQTKAAVIKAFLIKNFIPKSQDKEEPTMALNEQSTNKPYVLGRLFATLENLQGRANDKATIRERYFASACANPGSVFPTILKLSFHHMAKLPNAAFFEIQMGELLNKIGDEDPFPATLSLEAQGRFILGYYHQRQYFFTKKTDKEESKDEQPN